MTPTTPILDNFNRANGAPGANWPGAIRSSKALFAISSNVAANASGSGVTDEGYWTTASGANQECYFTVSALPTTGNVVRLHGRIQNPGTASPASYIFAYTPGTLNLQYFDGTNYTDIATASITLSAGDKMCLRCVGSQITGDLYQSGAWSVVANATDSNITSSGSIGIAINDASATLDDFGGGSLLSRLLLLGVG